MAKTISVNASLSCTGEGITAGGSGSSSGAQTGNASQATVQTTSTAGALISVGSLATYGGQFFIKNLDAAITIGIYQDGATATVKICDLLAGQFCLFPPAAALGCKAASGTPDLLVVSTEP